MAGTVPPTGARFRAPLKSSCLALLELAFARFYQTCDLATRLRQQPDQFGRRCRDESNERAPQRVERRQLRQYRDLSGVDGFAVDDTGLEFKDIGLYPCSMDRSIRIQ